MLEMTARRADASLVTTDEVLNEYLAYFANATEVLRQAGFCEAGDSPHALRESQYSPTGDPPRNEAFADQPNPSRRAGCTKPLAAG
jgi:hypothetical protein